MTSKLDDPPCRLQEFPPVMSRKILDGWDEIGDHLGVSRRTAQKWEKTGGLPVRRRPVGKKPRVYAKLSELDEWQESREEPKPPEPKKRRTWPPAIGMAVILSAGALWYATRPGPPASWHVNGTTLEILDSKGRRCWTKEFPDLQLSAYQEPFSRRHGLFADIDSDGQAEMVFDYLPQGIRESASGTLIFYDSDGTEGWRLDYGVTRHYRERELSQYYEIRILDTINTLGKHHILLVAYQRSFPTRVLLLKPSDGSIVQEYWHPGHLAAHVKTDLDDDGDEEVILGGVNNPGHGIGHPALLVLDFPLKQAPQGLPSYYPLDFTGGGEAAYYLFPTPDVAEALEIVSAIQGIHYMDRQYRLLVNVEGYGRIDYHLNEHFEIVGAWPSNTFETERRRLELQGTLQPPDPRALERILSFPTAPDANHPAIQELFEKPNSQH